MYARQATSQKVTAISINLLPVSVEGATKDKQFRLNVHYGPGH
jgi:hypothetical protein